VTDYMITRVISGCVCGCVCVWGCVCPRSHGRNF